MIDYSANPFLSVILPTYNRKYCIARMIDSVLIQSFKDFELIIIDDGSTDETVDFLEEKYCDKRIRIVRKENGGVSSARNLGISLATGKYITFVDSDDYLLDGFFEDIYLNLKQYKSEVLVYGGYCCGENSTIYAIPIFFKKQNGEGEESVKNGKNFLQDFCLFSGNSWGCAKVFDRKFILKYGILFNPCVSYGEDMLFVMQVYLIAPRVAMSFKKFYVYHIDTVSASRGLLHLEKKIENIILIHDCMKKYYKQNYVALNSIRHIKTLLLEKPFFVLKKQIKAKLSEICSVISLEDCGYFEKIEISLIRNNKFFRLSLLFFLKKITNKMRIIM